LGLCNNGQWKLREWSKLNYSRWAKRRGIQEVCVKKEERNDSPLDGKDMIQMDPNNSKEPEDIDVEDGADLDDTTDLGSGTSDDAEARPEEPLCPPVSPSSLEPFMRPLIHSLVLYTGKIGCCQSPVILFLTYMSPTDV
jgi:hypothetical protein